MNESGLTKVTTISTNRKIKPSIVKRRAPERFLAPCCNTEIHYEFAQNKAQRSVVRTYQQDHGTNIVMRNGTNIKEQLWQMKKGNGCHAVSYYISPPTEQKVATQTSRSMKTEARNSRKGVTSFSSTSFKEQNRTKKPQISDRPEYIKKSRTGYPLDLSLRESLEPRLGFDLSEVRVHKDGEIGMEVRKVNADAITQGHNIYFASGKWDPSSRRGKALLVHELTHVFQQQSESGKAKRLSPNHLQKFEYDAQRNEHAEYQNLTYLPVTKHQHSLSTPTENFSHAAHISNQQLVNNMGLFTAQYIDTKAPIQAASVTRNSNEDEPATPEAMDLSTPQVDMEGENGSLLEEAYNLLKYKLKIEKERMGN